MSEFVLVGQMVADIVIRPVDTFPRGGVCEMVEQIGVFPGGCTLNTALTMAKLGIKPVLVGKVGNDPLGRFLLDEVQAAGLNTDRIGREGTTSTAIVMVSSTGERSFYYTPGATATLSLDEVDLVPLESTERLHISGVMKLETLDMAALLRRAKGAGLTTSLDVDYDPTGRWLEVVQPYLPYVDLFLPSLDEARWITRKETPREMADFLRACGAGTVVIKMAEKGCYIRCAEEEITVPAYETQEIDATGAGDAFVGGFLVGLHQGWNLEESGRLGNACGALALRALGATTGIQDMEKTLQWMEGTPQRRD